LDDHPESRTGKTIAEPIKKNIRIEKLMEKDKNLKGMTIHINKPKKRAKIGETE